MDRKEVKINKEIRHYQESVVFGLTMRQLVCSVFAIVTALGLYFIFRDMADRETISWICILAATPFAAAGFFKYNGMTIEKFLFALIGTIIGAGVRVYKSENYYLKALHQSERRKPHGKDTEKQPAE